MTAVLRCKPRLRDPVGRCVPVEHWLVVIPLPAMMVRPGNASEAISAAVPSDAHS
jgi:hypothetical protein